MQEIKIRELGEGLRQLRGDLTMHELGKMIHLQVGYICELEKGQKIPSVNVINRYSHRLGVKIQLIFGG